MLVLEVHEDALPAAPGLLLSDDHSLGGSLHELAGRAADFKLIRQGEELQIHLKASRCSTCVYTYLLFDGIM